MSLTVGRSQHPPPIESKLRCRRRDFIKDALNSKLHAVCNRQGYPVVLLLSEGQMNDHKGAALMLLTCYVPRI